jgi:hypothetical protein
VQGGGKQAEEKGVGGLVACRFGFVGSWREEGWDTAVQGDGDTNLGHPLPRTLQENCFGFEIGKRGWLHTILLICLIVGLSVVLNLHFENCTS